MSLDFHSDDCLGECCHDHSNWQQWAVYPECDGCLHLMAQWIHENTDFPGCPIPEHCSYSPHCDTQWDRSETEFIKPGLVA